MFLLYFLNTTASSTASSSEILVEYLRLGYESLHSSWYIGVILGLISSFAGAMGDNLVRLSFVREQHGRAGAGSRGLGSGGRDTNENSLGSDNGSSKRHRSRMEAGDEEQSNRIRKSARSLFRRPLWLLGTFLTVVINPLLTVLALKFAAASIVLPFGGMHIFWNVILVGYLLQEKLLPSDFLGSACILSGITLVIAYGAHDLPPYTISSLKLLITRPVFLGYVAIVFMYIVYCMLVTPPFSSLPAWRSSSSSSSASHLGQEQERPVNKHTARTPFCTGGRNAAGLGLDDFLTDETVYSSTEEGRGGGRTRRRLLLLSSGGSRIGAPYWLQGFTVSSLSGVFGGLGNLSAKALIEIIGSEGIYNCLRRYEFFLSLALTAFLCGLQLFFLNVALYRYEAKYVVPMVNATLIASGSVGGILLFEEYAHMANTSIYAFGCGSFLVVMGILVLTTAASGAVSKAAQPEYIAKRIRELGCDGTEDERKHLSSSFTPPLPGECSTF
ncbi:magnesium transporter nipa [Cystoisospora suis]|uniref:Magnesium transporter nipa n=1 Tax=Cystoisospora suis TaxID=483139 RepID=A0A2C6KKL0_9APIC|nr:magnesium transporter nipa [Cystoisospora suis]